MSKLAGSARSGRPAGSNLRHWFPTIGLGSVLAFLVVVPLLFLVVSSFRPGGLPWSPGFTLDNYVTVYGDPALYPMLANTVIFVVGSVVLGLLLGGILAWLVERTDMPARRLVRVLVILPMATPPLLLAIAWIMLLSPRTGFLNKVLMQVFGLESAPFDIFTMSGMIFVEAIAVVPTTFLILSPAFRNMDPALEEAASASGAGGWRIVFKVFLPLMAPALLSAAIFISVAGFVVFDIPGAIGMPVRIFVLSSQIYYWGNETPTGLPLYGQISALAAVFLLVLLILGLIYQRATRRMSRYTVVSGKNYRPRAFRLGRWRYLALAFAVLYFVLAVAAPLLVLLWTSLMPFLTGFSRAAMDMITFSNHQAVFSNRFVAQAAMNTAIVAVVSATAVTVLSALISWVVVRSNAPGRRVLDLLSFLPISIPGVIIGVALIYVYLSLPFISIYGTIWIIILAYTTVYLSYGTRSLNSVLIQLHADLEDAGAASGGNWFRVFRKITVRLAMPGLIAVWVWVAAHAGRELSSALILQGRDNIVISTLLWDYWSAGQPNSAAAVGVWLIVVLGVLVGIWQFLDRKSR
jgi:iron(III) transport system permease protein